jgi:microcystin-dependent protein
MSNPFQGEIRLFGFNFAPLNWAFCDGSILPITQNTALFSLLGTTYGGNGTTTYALPDLRSRVPVSFGTSTTGNNFNLGQPGGEETVTIFTTSLPSHSHTFSGSSASANDKRPKSGAAFAKTKMGSASPGDNYYAAPGALTSLNANTVGVSGTGAAHTNLQPYLTINFCIALQGVYPTRP